MGSFSNRICRTEAGALAALVAAALLAIGAWPCVAQDAAGHGIALPNGGSGVEFVDAPTMAAAAAAKAATAGQTAASAQPAAGKSPIIVEADSLEADKEAKRINARGNVVVEWDSTRVGADVISVDERKRTVEGSGDVTYDSEEVLGSADSLRLDVDDETGVLENFDLRLKDEPGRFGGAQLEKLEGRHLRVDDGYFTTCDVEEGHEPDWELRGRKLDLRLDDYARLSRGRLQVRGVPVLYVPYLLFPTKQTRQSGLLSPSLGSSSRRGFLYAQPWFWNIDKQQDLTMTGVVETSARLGLDVEYRYAPSRRRAGRVDASYYNEAVRGDAEKQIDSPLFVGSNIPEDRGAIELTHREYRDNITGYADLQLVSDDLFLRETDSFSGDSDERELRRSRRYTTSRVGFLGEHGFTSGGVELIGYQNLVDSRDYTLQKPLSAWASSDRSLGPFVVRVDSGLASFMRQEGADGQRLDFATTAGLPLLVTDRLASKAWVRGRASAYAMNENELVREGSYEHFEQFPTRGIVEGGFDARTKVARDYALGSDRWTGIYHSLEPFVAFHYLGDSRSDVLPLYDGVDAIDARDVASYGVDSRFLLRRREGPDAVRGPFELGRLSLAQSYNLSQRVIDDHFSDIDVAAFVQPVEGLALRTLTSWNVGAAQVEGANASISWDAGPMRFLTGPRNQVAAAFRYVRSEDADILQSSELLARLGLSPRISLGLKGRYDFISSSFVEKGAGVTFSSSCQCWSIGVGVVERVNPDEFQVRLNFELAGLGGFGSGATSRTSPALDDVSYQDIGFWRAGW
ncbi:MAG: LPS-assembly protein LptD [Deltaproteobacteria bacterium]|nr:LPS-assembly protein LptD [Deltaproteobacteria bacterium]